MLREEELNMSPDDVVNSQQRKTNLKGHGEKDFSFIQNRVPSPLNNNFLLSEEQTRHNRQSSDGYMTAANNLMNQDEFKYGQTAAYDQDRIIEEDDLGGSNSHSQDKDFEEQDRQGTGGDDELETSKLSMFTDDNQNNHHNQPPECIIDNLDQNLMTMGTMQMSEGNNDDFNYSESNYNNIASSSLGAIIQGINSGSFVGFNNAQSNSNHFNNNNSRSSGARNLTSGRDSATPFNYDENSLMNLSQTPTSNHLMMKQSSLLLGKDRIISSTKLVHNQQYLQQLIQQQNQIIEVDRKEEEQDESMLPGSSMNFNKKGLSLLRDSLQQQKTCQDEWFTYNKSNPLEMPLQIENRRTQMYDHQMAFPVDITNDNMLFSRGKPTDYKDDLSQQLINIHQSNLHQHYNTQEDQDATEDEIQLIKKRLDFSRLSSMQNLSQQQIYLNQQFMAQNSFMFQTQQSLQSLQDTQHYSCIQNYERDQTVIPFEDILNDKGIKTAGRNVKNDQFNTTKAVTKDEGIQVYPVEQERFSCDTASARMPQEPGISPPSRTKTSLNTNRPPLIKNQSNINQGGIQVYPQKVTITNPNDQVSKQYSVKDIQFLNCINIFQGSNITTIPEATLPQGIIQQYQGPHGSKTTSTGSYTGSIVDSSQQQALLYSKHQKQKVNKTNISCNPLSDTPREPSLMIDESYVNGASGNPRKIMNMQNQIITNQQQIFNNQNFIMPFLNIQNQTVDMLASMTDNEDGVYETDESREQSTHQVSTNQSQQTHRPVSKVTKLKKKSKAPDNQVKDRQQAVGSSRLRKAYQDTKVQQISKQQVNFMSKTMIISKDKIQTAKSFNEQQQKQQQIIENIIHQNQQKVQLQNKQSITKIKKIKIVNSSQSGLVSNNQTNITSGKSLPNSNQSSAQTSFLTAYNAKKSAPQKTTSKKNDTAAVQSFVQGLGTQQKDIMVFEEQKLKKMMKKNKSIARQQIQTVANNTQKLNLGNIESDKEKVVISKLPSKCNTHRSVSRPKSGIQRPSEQSDVSLVNNTINVLGRKKNSQQVFIRPETSHQNKENMRPSSSNKFSSKKSLNLVGAPIQNGRPEQMLQSIDSIKLMNAQDLLSQIYSQQKKLQAKNGSQVQNLFQTLDATSHDISKRIKTEDNNYHHHMKSLQTFDTNSDLDPYHVMTLDTQRTISNMQLLTKQSQSKNSTYHSGNNEIYENLYKAVSQNQQSTVHHQQNLTQVNSSSSIQNMMQKMQSPYNSKTMKNKFSSIKNKKSSVANISTNDLNMTNNNTNHLNQIVMGSHGGKSSNMKSVVNLISNAGININNSTKQPTAKGNGGQMRLQRGSVNIISSNGQDNDQCRRCDELIHLIKHNTRFVGR